MQVPKPNAPSTKRPNLPQCATRMRTAFPTMIWHMFPCVVDALLLGREWRRRTSMYIGQPPTKVRSASLSMAELFQTSRYKMERRVAAPASCLRLLPRCCTVLISNDAIGVLDNPAQEQCARQNTHQLMEGCVADPRRIFAWPANVTAVGFEPTPFRTGT